MAKRPSTLFPTKIKPDFVSDVDTIKRSDAKSLNGIYFDSNKSFLRESSFRILDNWVERLQKEPDLNIQIIGYTDAEGNEKNNQILSENRGKSVVNYLISKGIKPTRISYKGLGEKNPISSNNEETGRQLNRRVELKIIDIK